MWESREEVGSVESYNFSEALAFVGLFSYVWGRNAMFLRSFDVRLASHFFCSVLKEPRKCENSAWKMECGMWNRTIFTKFRAARFRTFQVAQCNIFA